MFIQCLIDTVEHPKKDKKYIENLPVNINKVIEIGKYNHSISYKSTPDDIYRCKKELPAIIFYTGTNHDPVWVFDNVQVRDTVYEKIVTNTYTKFYEIFIALREKDPERFIGILNGTFKVPPPPDPPEPPPCREIKFRKP